MTSICIFGDSITQGAYDSQGGWAQRLKQHVKKNNVAVFISGVDGDTSTGLLQRLEKEVSSRKPDVIIIAIGINDSLFYNGRVKTSLAQFRKNIEKIIKISRKCTLRILILGLTCVDEKKTTPVPWNGWVYSNNKIKQYDSMLKEVSEEENVQFLELFSLLSVEDLEDGIHPTDEGHKKIFERVWAKLGV